MFQTQYGGSSLQEVFYYLEYWGISDILLPFILIFTIIYAVLYKIGLFEKKAKFNAVIALAISLMAVVPHVLGKYPEGMDIITIMNTALPSAALLILAVVMLLILTGLAYGKSPLGPGISGIFAIIASIILVLIFVSAFWPIAFIENMDPALKTLIIAILVFAVVFWYVTKPEAQTGQGTKTFGQKMQDLFGPQQ